MKQIKPIKLIDGGHYLEVKFKCPYCNNEDFNVIPSEVVADNEVVKYSCSFSTLFHEHYYSFPKKEEHIASDCHNIANKLAKKMANHDGTDYNEFLVELKLGNV